MRGVVAAGHPLTASAGADVLRAGGNAVDAAVAAVLMSFVAEASLTGPGAGGFMLVHTAGGEDHLLDFFVAAPGLGLAGREAAPLTPIDIRFSDQAMQRFLVGAPSCGAYGTTLGLAAMLERFGTARMDDLTAAPARAAREGVEVLASQAYLFEVLEPIFRTTSQCAALYAPGGRLLREGDAFRAPELGDLLDRLGAEGPGFLYTGDVAAAVSDWVLERGGLLTREDLASYAVAEREPARARFRGREVLTNPPPSSGGILIADALGILERLDRPYDAAVVAEVIAATNMARDEEFLEGLAGEGYLERFLAGDALDRVATEVRARMGGPQAPGSAGGARMGNTTHVSVMDGEGGCASVTCSNGSCSGVVVPGTGMHVNNMLGEQDLNPVGHRGHRAGVRVPSMMAPTVVLSDGVPQLAVGSAGSNRIRSAILQTILGVVDQGLAAQEAVSRPRIHVEGREVDAEPGVDEAALGTLEAAGWSVRRWAEPNLYFGGVQAVARDAATGRLSGGGDPRRGGVARVVD